MPKDDLFNRMDRGDWPVEIEPPRDAADVRQRIQDLEAQAEQLRRVLADLRGTLDDLRQELGADKPGVKD